MQRAVPMPGARGRSSSASVPLSGTLPISASPKRKQRPALSALSTSASSPQLRRLAELAATPSPSFSVGTSLLPSPMSDLSEMTVTPDTEVVTPGEAITYSPLESTAEEDAGEAGLASRWSLDSVASRPRITQMALDDASSSPASKTKKRDRLLSLISGRARSGSVTKPFPPPNTPRGSSDVLDIRRIDSRDAPSTSPRPSFTIPPKISMTPSLSSSNSSNASTLATPIEPLLSDDPFASDSPSCMPEDIDEEPVFAENPFYQPDSPLLPESPRSEPRTPPSSTPQPHGHEHLTLQIPERPTSPASPPPQPTLPLPSPSTPSPSFLVPSPRPQSFFATITGRQRRRKKKLVISGAPLELTQSRSSSSVSGGASDDYQHRQQEQQRRVQNVVKWCESFGPVKRVEAKDDGSLHVYWRDWEVADMVSVRTLKNLLICAHNPRRVGVPRTGAGIHQGCWPRQPRVVLHLMSSPTLATVIFQEIRPFPSPTVFSSLDTRIVRRRGRPAIPSTPFLIIYRIHSTHTPYIGLSSHRGTFNNTTPHTHTPYRLALHLHLFSSGLGAPRSSRLCCIIYPLASSPHAHI